MSLFNKFIFLFLSFFPPEHIKMNKKWTSIHQVESNYYENSSQYQINTTYQEDCQKHYEYFKATCPSKWDVVHEYLNVEVGTSYENAYETVVVLNCELVVICKHKHKYKYYKN
jgi:hypothetical protein